MDFYSILILGIDFSAVILKIFPPIDLRSINSKIDLFDGVLPPNMYGTFAGWGCIGWNDQR